MMERRILLAAMAAVVAAPALAQTGSSQMSPNQTSPNSTGDAAGTRSDAASNRTMGQAEQKHIKDTMAAGALSLLSSRVAAKKARDEDVKQFAEFEVAEQETIADVLMGAMDPSKASGKVNPPSDQMAMQHVDKDDQAMLKKMEEMPAGKAFDAAFVKAQTQGHEKLLRIQEDYLASGRDPSNLAIAKLARGQIKEHLTLLAELRDDDDDAKTQGRSKK